MREYSVRGSLENKKKLFQNQIAHSLLIFSFIHHKNYSRSEHVFAYQYFIFNIQNILCNNNRSNLLSVSLKKCIKLFNDIFDVVA